MEAADHIAQQLTKTLIDAFVARENRQPTKEEIEQLFEELTEERIAELMGEGELSYLAEYGDENDLDESIDIEPDSGDEPTDDDDEGTDGEDDEINRDKRAVEEVDLNVAGENEASASPEKRVKHE